MENEHFGTYLRRAREGRALLLSDVAQKTKVARSTLEAMERGDLSLLPAPVYVRGFIRSFARALSVDEASPLSLYERALEKRTAAQEAKESIPTVDPEALLAPAGSSADDEPEAPRRGLGLAVFVIILLLIATITLSLLLRRPPQSGEGLSLRPPAPSARLVSSPA
jgi:cytoskeletal protein RodZ